MNSSSQKDFNGVDDNLPHPLDIRSIFGLIIFGIVILAVIWPIPTRIQLPKRWFKWVERTRNRLNGRPNIRIIDGEYFTILSSIDFGIAPLLGVLIMVITTIIPLETVWKGISGTDNIQPMSIFVLFFGLAYLCVSLDGTGVFAYIALMVQKWSSKRGKGWIVWLSFWALSSCMTIATSNDIVILTLTPIIIYFTSFMKLDPIPFLMAEFHAANTFSFLLYIGNPTNIIVAQAYGLKFFEYFLWMLLPSITGGVVSLAMLWFVFRHRIPDKIGIVNGLKPEEALTDASGAKFGALTLASCLLTLIITGYFDFPVWAAVLPFSLLMVARDLTVDAIALYRNGSGKNDAYLEKKNVENKPFTDAVIKSSGPSIMADAIPLSPISPGGNEQALLRVNHAVTHHDDANDHDNDHDHGIAPNNTSYNSLNFVSMDDIASPLPGIKKSQASWNQFRKSFPKLSSSLERLPYKIAPFVLGMFILVEALNTLHWIDHLATALVGLVGEGMFRVTFVMGLLTTMACQILNNQPM